MSVQRNSAYGNNFLHQNPNGGAQQINHYTPPNHQKLSSFIIKNKIFENKYLFWTSPSSSFQQQTTHTSQPSFLQSTDPLESQKTPSKCCAWMGWDGIVLHKVNLTSGKCKNVHKRYRFPLVEVTQVRKKIAFSIEWK